MKFEKIALPDSQVFNGREFPVALRLVKDPATQPAAVHEFLKEKAKSGYFNKLLEDHGAIIFQNLGGSDPDSFAQFIKIIGIYSGDEFFEQNGTVAQRTEINDVLSTANEGPSSRTLYQHNEFSRFIKYPKKLFFACSEFDAEGGETPLVHGGKLFNDVFEKDPDFISLLSKKGLYLRQTWPLVSNNKTSWSDRFCFGRDLDLEKDSLEVKKQKAEKLVAETVSKDYEWDQKDNLVVHQHTSPIRIYKRTDGESFPTFFNSIATFYGDMKYSHDGHKKTDALKFDSDQDDMSKEALDNILESSINISYKHKWVKGDLALVDNYQVSHGRLPWEGHRKILVSMWDTPSKDEFEVWQSSST